MGDYVEISMYGVSLEHYVKSCVDFKALESAEERGTYNKAIMRFVLDFTRKTAPKRVWGVGRAQLLEDMDYAVQRFRFGSLLDLDGKAFAYRCREGHVRILFASSVDEYEYKLSEMPNAFISAFQPADQFEVVSEIHGDYVITAEGERFDLEYHLVDSIVNVMERIYERPNNL